MHELVAAEPRHHEIDDRDFVLLALKHLQRLHAILRGVDFEASALGNSGKKAPYSLVVVDDQKRGLLPRNVLHTTNNCKDGARFSSC